MSVAAQADERVLRLFGSCVAVRGARRSIICDLQYQRARLIPNSLFTILTDMGGMTVSAIKDRFPGDQHKALDKYFELLVRRGYAFWCDEDPARFPQVDLTWDHPATVTNAIIDVNSASRHDYSSLFLQLHELGCQAVQIRAYDIVPMSELERIVVIAESTALRHLDLILPWDPSASDESMAEFCKRHQVISRFILHGSPAARRVRMDPHPVSLYFLVESATPESCGQVDRSYFVLSLDHFAEAQQFNTCLNRKLSVTAAGDIKACPSMPASYGSYRSVSLREAATHPELRVLGSIAKDQIAVCKDCEFRYMCTDCRAYLSDPGDLYSKPAKCSYDPYTASWGPSVA